MDNHEMSEFLDAAYNAIIDEFDAEDVTDMDGPFTSPDPRLEYDFDTAAKLEIQIRQGGPFVKVDPNAFRSWTGARRINGEAYEGPTYFFLTNDRTR